MIQLSGIEDLFLRVETPTMPMHISSLTIYDPSTAPDGKVGFKDIMRFFEARMYRNKVFGNRLVGAPLGLGNSFWANDPDFDIEFHLRHIALPKPGDWRQLCIQLARLHARHLDVNRPLWECYVIEGLDNIPGLPQGCFALLLKTHYAALGGGLGTQLLAALHELMPNGRVSPPKHLPRQEGLPGMSDLMRNTLSNSLTWPLKMGAYLSTYFSPLQMFAGNALSEVVGWPLRILQRDGIPTIKNTIPSTVFNAPVSPHRVFEAVSFELAQLERMRDCVPGATINDVLITVIASAMREYLQHKGMLPESSLAAEAPMTSRSEMKVNSVRNLADSAIISMHTDCANPADRLRHIVQETRNNKKNFQSFLGKRLLIDATDLLPSVLLKSVGELIRRSRLGSRLPPQFNTSISSIRGPDRSLYMAGAKMVAYYGMDVVHDLAGINHLICYFAGNASISVTACRKMMPDPARYCACLQQAFVQLHAALLELDAAPALPAPGKRIRKRRSAAA